MRGSLVKKEIDTIVIGAGPAGSEAAYRIAKAGFSVLVLEKDDLDREKPCGGGIQLKELMEFGKPPSYVIEKRIRKARIFSPDNDVLEAVMKKGYAATVKRSVYDSWLQKRAQEAGAEFIKAKADNIKKAKKGERVIVSAGKEKFSARLLVDARGYHGQKVPELCRTFHLWMKGKGIEKRFSDAIELYFLEGLDDGYAWIFPKKDVVSVGVGTTKNIDIRKMLDDFIKNHPVASRKLKGLRTVKGGGGMIPLGMTDRLYDRSTVVVGDAGAFANIIHGGGIYQARKSAKIAAKHCISFLRDRNQDHLSDYGKEARDFFEDYEIKWDRKIRRILWNKKILGILADKGKKDDQIKEALGIVLTSAMSHETAYKIMEKKMLELIYSEMDSKTGLYKKAVNSGLRSIFKNDISLHSHANEALLNDKAKRLRAFIGILAAEMFGSRRSDAINFALVYEMFHTASLIHDDIIDESGKRRGKKTIHAKHGIPNAIITGDLMLSKGYSLISRYSQRLSHAQIRALLETVGDTGERCCIGQSMDIEMAKKKQYDDIAGYLKMIELKTGSLIEGSVKGGAVVGGAGKKQIRDIGEFGKNMGMAFQIIDDSLDLLGGAKANKSVMNDLKQGKATPMLVHALKNACSEDKKKIMKLPGNKNMTAKMAKGIIEIYRDTGSIEYAQRLSHAYIENARKELIKLPKGISRDKFSELLDIMDYWSLGSL